MAKNKAQDQEEDGNVQPLTDDAPSEEVPFDVGEFNVEDGDVLAYLALLKEETKSSGGGDFFFPAKGRTVFVVVASIESLKARKPDFMAVALNHQYVSTRKNGKPSRKAIIMAWILQGDKKDESGNPIPLDERYVNTQVPLVLPVTAANALISTITEGWDVFGRPGAKVNAVVIKRSGEGINTEYEVQVSRKTTELPADFKYSEKSAQQWAAEYEEQSKAPRTNNQMSEEDGGEVDLGGGGKKSTPNNGQRQARSTDEW